jgi:carboxypeptidase C (cathepsin A)
MRCRSDIFVLFLCCIIPGESYGGHYVPAWANAILNFNEQASASNKINFAGVVIGNGCTNDTVQNTDRFIEFQHENNLIPSTSNPRNQAAAEAAMVSYIGYTPNYYDFRLESVSCGVSIVLSALLNTDRGSELHGVSR